LPNSQKKSAFVNAGGKLSPGYNENWNTKLHGPIATKKKLTKRLGKCVCYNGSRHIMRGKKLYNHYI
jgi:hypothetical protein